MIRSETHGIWNRIFKSISRTWLPAGGIRWHCYSNIFNLLIQRQRQWEDVWVCDTWTLKRQTFYSCPAGNWCHSNEPLLSFPPPQKTEAHSGRVSLASPWGNYFYIITHAHIPATQLRWQANLSLRGSVQAAGTKGGWQMIK